MYRKQFTYGLCGYEITSYGNGAAYTVRHGTRSFHMQGDDAAQLSEELESDNPEYYLSEYMALIGQDDTEAAV